MIQIYNVALILLLILGLPLLLPYVLLSAKRRGVVLQRLGLTGPAIHLRPHSPDAGPIWVHALSVGEVMAAVPLVHSLVSRYAGRPIVFSASTLSGHETVCQKMAAAVAAVCFFPYDLPLAVKRAAARIEPALVVIIETDIWPNFLCEMKRRGVPVILANAKLSDRSFAGYRRAAAFSKYLFGMLAQIACQTQEDADRFRRLGIPAERIQVTGNIKFDQGDEASETKEIAALRAALDSDPPRLVWLAGSTHAGEEAIIRKAYTEVKKTHPTLMLIIAPRDPSRASEVGRLFKGCGFGTVALSALAGREPKGPIEVVVTDTLGLLKQLYALADVALVGGSLLKIRGIGGHNPLEPAAFAKPILFGPHMHNFREIAALLTAAGGALQVTDAPSLRAAVDHLLQDRDRARRMGQDARCVFDAHKGAVARTLAIVTAQLPCA